MEVRYQLRYSPLKPKLQSTPAPTLFQSIPQLAAKIRAASQIPQGSPQHRIYKGAFLSIFKFSSTDCRRKAHLEDLQEPFGIAHSTIQIETGDPQHPCVLAPDHVLRFRLRP
jgi:hypothetical protein